MTDVNFRLINQLSLCMRLSGQCCSLFMKSEVPLVGNINIPLFGMWRRVVLWNFRGKTLPPSWRYRITRGTKLLALFSLPLARSKIRSLHPFPKLQPSFTFTERCLFLSAISFLCFSSFPSLLVLLFQTWMQQGHPHRWQLSIELTRHLTAVDRNLNTCVVT